MVWWKVALPVVIAGSGIAAATVAIVRSDDTAAAGTSVWIDAPADLAAVNPGVVVVQAHVDVSSGIESLTLTVDGDDVATDDQLEVNEQLAYAEFEWTATEGAHELRVVAPDGSRSGVHTVLVAAPGTEATTTTSTTVVETTTTTLPETTTTTSTTLPPTTLTPTTAPPVTVAKPTIGAIGVTPGDCSITVTVSIANATSATVRVTGGANDTTVPLSPVPGAASAIVALRGSAGSTMLTIAVTATGSGGTATATTTFLASFCKE